MLAEAGSYQTSIIEPNSRLDLAIGKYWGTHLDARHAPFDAHITAGFFSGDFGSSGGVRRRAVFGHNHHPK
jgi:hypothetical protein